MPARQPIELRRLYSSRATRRVLLAALSCLCTASVADASVAEPVPVARIGATLLTDADLGDAIRAKEAKQKLEHERKRKEATLESRLSEAELHTTNVERLVNERVLALEATAHHTTASALLEAVKVVAATPAEAREVYEAHAREINQPYEAVEKPLIEELTRQHGNEARYQYLLKLRAQYHARVLVEPLRFDVAATGPERGPEDAPVTMILFADFQCPYCAQLVPVLSQVLAQRPQSVRLVFRHFPLDSLHPLAAGAARAAVCAEKQGRFWELHDTLFANPKQLDADALRATAVSLGLDATVYDGCVTDPATQKPIDRDVAVADEIGLSGTPALFVNGRLLRGTQPLASVLALIDDELARRERQ